MPFSKTPKTDVPKTSPTHCENDILQQKSQVGHGEGGTGIEAGEGELIDSGEVRKGAARRMFHLLRIGGCSRNMRTLQILINAWITLMN